MDTAALIHRDARVLHTIYNMFEQDPGRAFFPVARERGVGVLVRVPHSSGMLEGRYTKDTVFGENDHRRHRTKEWLEQGLAAYLPDAHCIGNGSSKEGRVVDGSEWNKVNPILEVVQQFRPHVQAQPGLACASRPCESDKPHLRAAQQGDHLVHLHLPTNKSGGLAG